MTTKEPVQVSKKQEGSKDPTSSSSVVLSTLTNPILSMVGMEQNSNSSDTIGMPMMTAVTNVTADAALPATPTASIVNSVIQQDSLNDTPQTPTPTTTLIHRSSTSSKMKHAPICQVPALRKEHMTALELSNYCFESLDSPITKVPSLDPKSSSSWNSSATSSSSSSSTSHNQNHLDPRNANNNHDNHQNHVVTVNLKAWDTFKRSILQRQESRTGRDRQRFDMDPVTGERIRLVTGTVPIMKNGHILLISSSSKPEWILPKGGWESDESCEVR